MWFLNLAFLLVLSFVSGSEPPPPTIETLLGTVEGTWKVSEKGREFASFTGIPFAKPPVNELRFKPPEPKEPWTGVWKATTPYTCIQKALFLEIDGGGDEDCLYLNIYIPKHLMGSKNVDVLVHIHGGAFMVGSGHGHLAPNNLMDRDLIFITFNYRLGIFGFLSTEDNVIAGNMGMKDQSLALKWIKDNVQSFGGNPDSITITGLSAGAASVHLHYLSPLSKGLFHRGLSISGTAVNSWAIQEKAAEKARKLGEYVGCPTKCSKELLKCLQERPAHEILNHTKKYVLHYGYPVAPFAPVVEKSAEGAFLTEYPYKAMVEGKIYDVPWVSTMTKDEGLFFAKLFIDHMDEVSAQWPKLAPILLDFDGTALESKWSEISEKIRSYYFKSDKISYEKHAKEIVKMCNERYFLNGNEVAMKLQASKNKSPVYSYLFDYLGRFSLSSMIPSKNKLTGTTHADEVFYIFGSSFAPNVTANEEELKMREQFLDFLAGYAKNGVPKFGPVTDWKPVKEDTLNILSIKSPSNIKMETVQDYSSASFWSTLGLREDENILNSGTVLGAILIDVCSAKSTPNPVVETKLGKIEGVWKKSTSGKEYAAFEGVPYAKPPVGKLRFKNPVPVEPWAGTWKANQLYTCIQKQMFQNSAIIGQEDCLYLNIYVPKKVFESKKQVEVIVHIHGGGFTIGSGHEFAHPGYLMDHEVIFVTFNYRLGVLGFLSTNDEVIPGNFGLKDQSMALKWVQDNIKPFGGNAKSVTLMGVSAGGASVHYHYLSPLSKGLFHRGFSQSGSALNCWALEAQPLDAAKQLAEVLGCDTKSSKKILDCLMQRPDKQLMEAFGQFVTLYGSSTIKFVPVVEQVKTKGTFLSTNPMYTMEHGEIYNVPWISALTKDEGLLFLKLMIHDLDNIDKNWNKIAPYLLQYSTTAAESTWPETSEDIRQHYFGDQPISSKTLDKFMKILNDRLFVYDIETAIRLHAKRSKAPVYSYQFNYLGGVTLAQFFPGDIDIKSATHGDDILYLYPFEVFNNTLPTESDRKLRDVMVQFLVNYAKTGKVKIGSATWDAVPKDGQSVSLLAINGPEDFKMEVGKELSPRKFWKELGLLENQGIVLMKDEL